VFFVRDFGSIVPLVQPKRPSVELTGRAVGRNEKKKTRFLIRSPGHYIIRTQTYFGGVVIAHPVPSLQRILRRGYCAFFSLRHHACTCGTRDRRSGRPRRQFVYVYYVALSVRFSIGGFVFFFLYASTISARVYELYGRNNRKYSGRWTIRDGCSVIRSRTHGRRAKSRYDLE